MKLDAVRKGIVYQPAHSTNVGELSGQGFCMAVQAHYTSKYKWEKNHFKNANVTSL
jgi:hypothetical protein